MYIMMVHHFGQIGGGTNSCFDVCRMLIESGHDVAVVIPNPSYAVEQLAQNIGVRLIPITKKAVRLSCHNADSGTAKEIIKSLISVQYVGYWKKLFQIENPDLIMFNSSVLGPLVCLSKRLGFKTICFIRETIRESAPRLWRSINCKLLAQADGLAYLTQYDISAWGIPGAKYHTVIPDIVDEARFKSSNTTDQVMLDKADAKYLLYLGGFSEEKGALDLLRAFEICVQRNPDLYLLILGDTRDFSEFKGIRRFSRRGAIAYSASCRSKMLEINQRLNRVLEVGLVSDVASWYQKSDAVIFPVKKVHQARPIYEAGLFHKPVIVPDYANFQDNLRDGYNGLTYKKDDIMDMAEKILTLFDNIVDMSRMGENNFLQYQTEHVFRKSQESVVGLIKNVKESV